MKKRFLAVVAIFVSTTVFGQGTIEFRTTPDGANAIPAHTSFRLADGLFTLSSDGSFTGSVGVSHFPNPTSVSIYSSSTPTQLGTKLYDLAPGGIVFPFPPDDPGGQQFNFSRTLTLSETSDLLAGTWWINVSTPDFPNGELRGQILAVPEPSSVFLIGSALGALYFLSYRRLKNA